MENSGSILFEDDKPHWYIALGDRWIGPMSAADVYQKVLSQEISWAHYVWRPGEAAWTRICDTENFQAAVPREPTAKPAIKQAAKRPGPPPAPAAPKNRLWFLFYSDTQYGPFSSEEVDRFLRIGKIHGRVFAWKDGMAGWERLDAVPEFKEAVEEANLARAAKSASPKGPPKGPPKAPKKADQRGSVRRPLVAKIMVANQESVIVGVCRDISIGGMQILTDRVPGAVGAKVKMNVSPSSGGPEPFVAEGEIVRILEDGRGFSFRFNKLTDSAKRAVESYIHAEAH